VPPVLVEDKIKSLCPIVSNVVLIGDKRKFLTILLTLRVVVDPITFEPTTDLDPSGLIALGKISADCTAKTLAEAKADERVTASIQAGIDQYNSNFAASRAQKVQKWVILDGEFSMPGGELTATQKLKRNVVTTKYAKDIEALYAE